ncbi:MAG: hypothetical protein HY308_17285 [Gammaproteobacteria bacterium]|nr:hypothetical protein [Gammaproteobacteria bacterium]
MKTFAPKSTVILFSTSLWLAGCGGGSSGESGAPTPDPKPDPTPTYTLTLTKSGSGGVTSAPAGIDCGSDCSESYASGAVVTLTAAPAADSIFSGWGGDCSGSNLTCTVTLSAARNVSASFTPRPESTFTLTVTIAGGGTVSSNPAGITDCSVNCSASFSSGTRVTLTATPVLVAGHTFSGWSGAGCSGVTPCVIDMTAVRNVIASFAGPPDNTLSDFERHLVELPPDTWYEAPATHMMDVCAPASFGVHATVGCPAIVDAWGGGAFDPVHRKMLIWGGGHADYYGNEVYSFDLRTGKWERLTDPTLGSYVTCSDTSLTGCVRNMDPLLDGNPNSRHTYGGLQYMTHLNRFFSQGGALAPSGVRAQVTWLFNVESRTWNHPAPTAANPSVIPQWYGMASGYDPTSGLVLMASENGLSAFDASANTWTGLASFNYTPFWPRYAVSGNKHGAVDTKRHLFWVVGVNDIMVWDIPHAKMVTNDWGTSGGGAYTNYPRTKNYVDPDPAKNQVFTSGGGDIYDANAPGFDYDSKADQFVAWKGGTPYVLDLATKTWTIKSATGAPVSQVTNGTYGRWRYLERYNVFILVNSVTGNIYFYKNTAGGP